MSQEEAMPTAVAFSWEHEPGVSKQSPGAKPGPAPEAQRAPGSPKKAPPAARRLHVPPPPGGPGAPAVPRARSVSRTRGVRPEDDPFLAAYLACTKSGKKAGDAAREPKGRRQFGWAGLRRGLGLGLGLGLGFSCKGSNGVVEDSTVRLAKMPEVDSRDA